jgi:transglutaminase-like putative cysteine protease
LAAFGVLTAVARVSRERIRFVTLFRPISRRTGRFVSVVVLGAWVVTLGFVLTRAYVQARSMNLATDLARYGTAAEWRGVYYRGEKIGFSVSQTTPSGDGFEVREDARLQMSLFGATTPAAVKTIAQVDAGFGLKGFDFSLDPGTGPVQVSGTVTGRHVSITIKTASGTQREERDLDAPPALNLNLPRRMAAEGFKPGTQHSFLVFDPATLRNETVTVSVGKREIVTLGSVLPVKVGNRQVFRPTRTSIPAFRLDLTFGGLHTTSWVTDTGEVVKEESPLGFSSVRESPEDARRLAGRGTAGAALIENAAVVPRWTTKKRVDDARDVRRVQMRVEGLDIDTADVSGAGQSLAGDVLEVRDPRSLAATATPADLRPFLAPEPLLESDDPEIRRQAEAATAGATDPRARAERLTRAVNAMLDKKATVGLPSAREVLRTKVGDCNEHTALYVAMARSIGLPARIAVGLAYTRGAFYYHAWPEVYLDEGRGRGRWLPTDPTFNEFPADAMHVRLLRGGLDKQAAILPLIGKVKMDILDLDLAPNSTPVLVGRGSVAGAPLPVPLPMRAGLTCWTTVVGGASSRPALPAGSLAGPR